MAPRLHDVRELLFACDLGNFGLRWRLWSARRATPLAARDLSSAVGRRAKVVGTARPLDGSVAAPFTQRPSLAWRTKLEETRRNESGVDDRVGVRGIELPNDDPFGYRSLPVTADWRTWLRDSSAVPMAVDEDSSTVVVDPRHAVLALPYELVSEHPCVNDENARLRAYLGRNGVSTTLYMGMTGDHRFYEAILRPGDRVAVWGLVFEQAGAAQTGYRDSAMRAFVIGSTPREPCVIHLA